MKKRFCLISLLLTLLPGLSGCSGVGNKSASLVVVYSTTAVLSLLVLLGYLLFTKKKDLWFVLLLSSVLTVNCGYLYLALSPSLGHALMANRIAYLGSVLLPLSMFMIILNTTKTRYKKWLPGLLFAISGIIFAIAASPGILDIYYKEVSFAVVDGVSTLIKVYGPLHPVYLLFLLGYFVVMVAAIVQTFVKKTTDSTTHSILLAVAVFVNIGVWFIEQLVRIDFEMLSVSYIISELFLLGLTFVEGENQRLKKLVKDAQIAQKAVPAQPLPDVSEPVEQSRIDLMLVGLETLTQTERKIYDAYVARATTKEIMAAMNITENTLKFHNKNIYSKLGVSSRKELLQIYSQLSK